MAKRRDRYIISADVLSWVRLCRLLFVGLVGTRFADARRAVRPVLAGGCRALRSPVETDAGPGFKTAIERGQWEDSRHYGTAAGCARPAPLLSKTGFFEGPLDWVLELARAVTATGQLGTV